MYILRFMKKENLRLYLKPNASIARGKVLNAIVSSIKYVLYFISSFL
jgi:hypothetical protein